MQAGRHGKFGFFAEEQDQYRRIADDLGIICLDPSTDNLRYVRHPLVYLTEAADDICYEIMDIEDAHELNSMRPPDCSLAISTSPPVSTSSSESTTKGSTTRMRKSSTCVPVRSEN